MKTVKRDHRIIRDHQIINSLAFRSRATCPGVAVDHGDFADVIPTLAAQGWGTCTILVILSEARTERSEGVRSRRIYVSPIFSNATAAFNRSRCYFPATFL